MGRNAGTLSQTLPKGYCPGFHIVVHNCALCMKTDLRRICFRPLGIVALCAFAPIALCRVASAARFIRRWRR